MADIIRTINQALQPGERYLVVTQSGTSTGDIIRVVESLGHAGTQMRIDTSAGCDLSIRVNSHVKVFPVRKFADRDYPADIQSGELLLVSGVDLDTGVPSIVIGGSATQSYAHPIEPIRDVELTFTTGTFEIFIQ